MHFAALTLVASIVSGIIVANLTNSGNNCAITSQISKAALIGAPSRSTNQKVTV